MPPLSAEKPGDVQLWAGKNLIMTGVLSGGLGCSGLDPVRGAVLAGFWGVVPACFQQGFGLVERISTQEHAAGLQRLHFRGGGAQASTGSPDGWSRGLSGVVASRLLLLVLIYGS